MLLLDRQLLNPKIIARKLIALSYFYQRLIIPNLLISLLVELSALSILRYFSLKPFGISYMLIGLLIHYYTYELRNSNQYYFYRNLGLSRLTLWLFSFSINFIVGVILIYI